MMAEHTGEWLAPGEDPNANDKEKNKDDNDNDDTETTRITEIQGYRTSLPGRARCQSRYATVSSLPPHFAGAMTGPLAHKLLTLSIRRESPKKSVEVCGWNC
jgi:hypothetical protein